MYRGLIHRYREYLPLDAAGPVVTLHEGNTPLVRAENLERRLPGIEIYLKFDGLNPTGSFKDRGMTMAVSQALAEGSQAVICASTGNTSASAAAYAARANMKAFVLIPDNKIAMGKLAQAVAYGADIVPIAGNFDQALELVRKLADQEPVTLVNSVNPFRIEGQKTAAFEIVDDLGAAPDYLCIPVGNAGNITAYWKGFQEYHALGKCHKLPRLFGFQAAGAAPMVLGHPVQDPETIATAIRIGNPASWKNAVQARYESGGIIDMVSDDEIMHAWHTLANKEGIFGEPASAASVAGLIKLCRLKYDFSNSKVTCVITGTGLKDSSLAISEAGALEPVKPELAIIEKVLGLK